MIQKTILAVDDDEEVRRFYGRMFSENRAMNVNLAATGEEALDFVSKSRCDCVILDLGMPGMNGFDVLKQIRSKPELLSLPVVVVTGSKEDRDGVRALSLGADDYINKPFSVPIFEAKMQKLLDRGETGFDLNAGLKARMAGILQAGPIKMDLPNRRVHLSGVETPLTEKEFDLLYCLFRRSPGLVRWDTIHREVWQYELEKISSKQSKVLQVTLSRLKAKLGPVITAMLLLQKGQGLRLELRSI